MTTRIIQVRLCGEPEDVTELAALIAEIPGITATGVSLRENYRDRGVRGYLTVTVTSDITNADNPA
jgi:hypothetical protein